MKNVIIIGNSGAALETYELFYSVYYQSPSYRWHYTFKGFLSHRKYTGCLGALQSLELGSDDEYQIEKDDVFITAIGDNAVRMDAYQLMKEKNAQFINLISPFSAVSPTLALGENNIIGLGSRISMDVKVGNSNYLNGDICLAHHVQVGDGNFFGPRSMAMGNVRIGDMNRIGTTAVLLEHSSIGSHNSIAPGSIVYKGCKDNCRLSGNPAFII